MNTIRTIAAGLWVWAVLGWVGPIAAEPWKHADASAVSLPTLPREFRGAWVATVANIDWPTKRELPVADQRAEMLAMVESLRETGFNAVVLQVRPACDAIYPSTLEPWSEFVTGESGKAPVPAWDPLAEWIMACHSRGMELHAWVNPFRARHFDSKLPDAPNHISRTQPQWVKSYDRYLWLDPGEPGARDHAMAVFKDLLTRYDVDGLHIDDYFYPYPKGDEPFPDSASFDSYRASGGTLARDDWRRDNINRFVKLMYETAHQAKPGIKVGISPFGIWRPGNPADIKGFDAYAKLYADAKLWLNEGWMDYCSPQLYWKRDAKEQAFVSLLGWWRGQNVRDRALWPGLYSSRLLPSESPQKTGWTSDEIVGQLRDISNGLPTTPPGAIHFSAKAILGNAGGLRDALRAGPYASQAVMPAMSWLDAVPPPVPELVADESAAGGGVELTWSVKEGSETVARWVVAARSGGAWSWRCAGADERAADIGVGADAVAVWAQDRAGNLSAPAVRQSSPVKP